MHPERLMTLDATITRLTRGATADRYGDPDDDEETVVVKCWLEQTRRTEDTTSQDLQDTTWDLYLPAGTAIAGSDRIEVAGDSYELFGPPWEAISPRTAQATHIEATLKRTV